MASVYDDDDDDEIKFRRGDTGYNTLVWVHSPLRSVRVASETSNVSVAELEQTLAAVNKRISELSAVRDSTFAWRNLRSVFDRTHGQDDDRRHVLRTVSESVRHSMGLPWIAAPYQHRQLFRYSLVDWSGSVHNLVGPFFKDWLRIRIIFQTFLAWESFF